MILKDPKTEICCTDAKRNWDPNNLYFSEVSTFKLKTFQLCQDLKDCLGVVAICSGMGAANFIFKDPKDLRSMTYKTYKRTNRNIYCFNSQL